MRPRLESVWGVTPWVSSTLPSSWTKNAAANKYSFTDETEYEFKHFAMYYIRKHVQRAMGR